MPVRRDPMERFLRFCRFEPETGCVVWTGAKTRGRGHHVPYASFWFEGRSWYGHRWAAKFIHGLDIDNLQVDHCCPNLPKPNTLCVQHLQAVTLRENRRLQDMRKHFIYLQVGLLDYEEVYGFSPDPPILVDAIPFHTAPSWLSAATQGSDDVDCPF